MAPPFSQLLSSTYDDVVNERNKAADQWSDSSFLKTLEKLGGVKKVPGGATLQLTLDYRANAGVDFMATDVTPTSTSKTDVLTQAQYNYVPLVSPINWTLFDEAVNSDTNQKVDLISALVDNGLTSHDQAVEVGAFAPLGGTDGFNSLLDLYTHDGTGTVGTIPAGTELWWKNKFIDYGTQTGPTLLASYTALYNACKKGSLGRAPNVVVGSAREQAIFEAALTQNQRFVDVGNKISASAETLAFKQIPFIFTGSYSGRDIFMFNTNDTQLFVVSSAWRKRREATEFTNAAMMNMKIFSVLQLATRNRSRGGVLFTAAP